MSTPKIALTMLLLGAPLVVTAAELHVQCPAGTGAVIKGDTVVCEPLPRSPAPRVTTTPPPQAPPQQPQNRTFIVQQPPPVTTSNPGPEASFELAGLQGVPEICGLNTLPDSTVEAVAESVHMAVQECANQVGARPPLTPTRWMVFRFTPLDEKSFQAISPPDVWSESMNACLVAQPAKIPRAARGKPFTAWYLMANNPNAIPSSPACVERR